jgi:Flp pilus assembly pilin Flp
MLYHETVRGSIDGRLRETIDGVTDGAIRLQVLLDNWSGLIEERLEANLERRLEGKEPSKAGQSLVEYAIALALIAIAAMGAVQALGGGVGNLFQRLVARIQGIG